MSYVITKTRPTEAPVASVAVTLKGEYSGIKKASFEIVPKGTSISNVTAKRKALALEWKKQTSQTTGYQIQYSTSEKFTKKTTETVTIRKNKTTAQTISKLKAFAFRITMFRMSHIIICRQIIIMC